ncbi:MAG: serine/threonine-protein kinase, partial [Bacteroidota bacterium]
MKILKWSEPKLVELFEREADTLQSIDHPSIPRVTIDDFFTFTPNGTSITLRCLVMDKFEGLDLYEWIKENGKISEKLALNWLNQLVEILDELHHSEFFHRDIKPSNIVCRPNGKLALIDFGATRRISDTYLAKVGASGGTSTKTGRHEITSIITTGYSPTEQINGRAVPQSDFYALGRTFIHLLTGIPLDQLPTSEKTGRLIWRDKAPQINRPLANLIDDLQAELPGQRPQNTKVILQRLSRL